MAPTRAAVESYTTMKSGIATFVQATGLSTYVGLVYTVLRSDSFENEDIFIGLCSAQIGIAFVIVVIMGLLAASPVGFGPSSPVEVNDNEGKDPSTTQVVAQWIMSILTFCQVILNIPLLFILTDNKFDTSSLGLSRNY